MVQDFVLRVLVFPFVIVVVGIAVAAFVRRASRLRGRRAASTVRVLPAVVLALVVPMIGAWSLGSAVQVRQYLASRDPSIDAADYYVEPTITDATQHKNLVLIYLESIEDALADDGMFAENMIAPIEGATSTWDRIPQLTQYPGGGWTMSGIVATQCGVPLRMPSGLEAAGTDTFEQAGIANKLTTNQYLPAAVCLGDVLAEHGYTNVFFGGASTSFAAKGDFFNTHGYEVAKGLNYWKSQGETEISERWGLSDRRLFENAKEELTRLEESGEDFSLTLLTLDTHEPPYQFEYCDWTNEEAMVDATRCSMDQVAGFVQFMEDRGYLENTVVVVMGDHLKLAAEGSAFHKELHSLDERAIFNRIHTPNDSGEMARKVDQLSMFPTILEAAGFDLEDGRAGMGQSAYRLSPSVGTLRALSPEQQEVIIRSHSASFYDSLWGSQPPTKD